MTPRDRLTKNILFLAVVLYYIGGYLLINEFSAGRGDFHRLGLPFEERIPFLPALVFAYALVYGFLAFTYLVVDDLPFFRKIARAFLLCITIHFAFFLIFPVKYPWRPEIDPTQGWAYGLVDFYYWLDRPYNCFPSLHISNSFLVAFLLNRFRPGCGWVLHPLSILVAVSVVLVKQHYVADVISGFFVAWGVYRVILTRP